MISYQVEALQAAAESQVRVASACLELQRELTAHGVRPAMLGTVPAAAAFHATVAHLVGRQAVDAGVESLRRADLAQRAGRTGMFGARLIADTSAAARAGAPHTGS